MILRLALKALGLGLVFAAALMLGCMGIHALLPLPDISEVRAKLEYLRQHPADYDTLFLGSSRVYHQIMPDLFDSLATEQGAPTKSFNAGVDGMRPPELNFYCDQILRAHPRGLRWIFIEAGVVRVHLDDDKRGTERATYWHDFKRMRLLWQAAMFRVKSFKRFRLSAAWKSFQEPWEEFSTHLPLFVQDFTNLGRAKIFTGWLMTDTRRPFYWGALGPKKDGFNFTGRGEQMKPDDGAAFVQALQLRRQKVATIESADEISERAFDSMLHSFEKLGARVVILVPPTTGLRKYHPREVPEAHRLLLDFSDPVAYPSLYTMDVRLDTDHLNTEGARIFTRLLVQRFVEAGGAAPAPAR